MDIIVVEHKDISVKSAKQYLHGSTKKKDKVPKHKEKRRKSWIVMQREWD